MGGIQVHILNEDRGATLETVVARMRTSNKNIPVRVVALSATVSFIHLTVTGIHLTIFIALAFKIPNVEDVARWLRPTIASSSAVFEAGGVNPGIERGGANGILQMPMAKVFKVSEIFEVRNDLFQFTLTFLSSGKTFDQRS